MFFGICYSLMRNLNTGGKQNVELQKKGLAPASIRFNSLKEATRLLRKSNLSYRRAEMPYEDETGDASTLIDVPSGHDVPDANPPDELVPCTNHTHTDLDVVNYTVNTMREIVVDNKTYRRCVANQDPFGNISVTSFSGDGPVLVRYREEYDVLLY